MGDAPKADARRASGGVPPVAAVSGVWRTATVAAAAALGLMSIAWEAWLAPLRPGGSLLVLKALPLAVLLPGLARGRVRSFQVCSMLILAYLAEGVVRGMTDAQPSAAFGWIETLLAGAVFAAVLAHMRSLRGDAPRRAEGTRK